VEAGNWRVCWKGVRGLVGWEAGGDGSGARGCGWEGTHSGLAVDIAPGALGVAPGGHLWLIFGIGKVRGFFLDCRYGYLVIYSREMEVHWTEVWLRRAASDVCARHFPRAAARTMLTAVMSDLFCQAATCSQKPLSNHRTASNIGSGLFDHSHYHRAHNHDLSLVVVLMPHHSFMITSDFSCGLSFIFDTMHSTLANSCILTHACTYLPITPPSLCTRSLFGNAPCGNGQWGPNHTL
jgi:hypothetical protein